MKYEIECLCKKFKERENTKKTDKMSEEETKKDFILPLFKALGWDVYNSKTENEVSAEEKISNGYVDYGFRINDIPKFFLEAKSVKKDVDNDKDAFQAINYAYAKGTTWAILTNFKKMRVFNSEIRTKNALTAQFFTLSYTDYIKCFEQLYPLCRSEMKNNTLDKIAEKWGKKVKKSPIDEQLLEDLTKFRLVLKKNIKKMNKEKSLLKIQIEESAQKILARLIFMRTMEDRKNYEPVLHPIMADGKEVYAKLCVKFTKFDAVFNSNLFEEHLCDKLTISDSQLEDVIRGLHHTEDKSVYYNFAAIDTDVLGAMYEQYLGHLQKNENKSQKKKDSAIYYTPKYVVNYIVENTVGRSLKDNKIPKSNKKKKLRSKDNRMPKIRVVDPACGSGSFLLGVLDYLIKSDPGIDRRQSNVESLYVDKKTVASEKMMIVMNSIFGVDLDEQAIPITRLNIMLKVAKQKEKLLRLDKNIHHGDSLLTEKKYSRLAFNWNKIFNNQKFDVVVGNPPYYSINKKTEKFKNNLKSAWPDVYAGNADILYFFHALSLEILKENGYFGMITSRYFLEAKFAYKLRNHILNNAELIQIIDFGSKVHLFKNAGINTCIIIYKKTTMNERENLVNVIKVKDWTESNEKLFEYIRENSNNQINESFIEIFAKPQNTILADKWTLRSPEMEYFINNLYENSNNLSDICDIGQGFTSGMDDIKDNNGNKIGVFRVGSNTIEEKELEREILKPVLKIGMVRRYKINWTSEYLIFTHRSVDIDDYPNIKSHLEEFKDALKNRYDIKKSEAPWYQLANLRNYDMLTSTDDKLFVPMTAPENRFVYIRSDEFICSGDLYVIKLKNSKFNLRYVQGVLNSKLMNLFMKHNSKKQDGSAKTSSGDSNPRRSYTNKHISNIPIKNIPTEQQNEIANKVTRIESLYNEFEDLHTTASDNTKNEIKELNDEIETLICDIYGTSLTEIDGLNSRS